MSKLTCNACSGETIATSVEGIYEHAVITDCVAVLLDGAGASYDWAYEIVDGIIYEIEDAIPPDTTADSVALTVAGPTALVIDPSDDVALDAPLALVSLPKRRVVAKPDFFLDVEGIQYPYRLFEDAVLEIFAETNAPRLGGASGNAGWSSFSTFQRCPYLWRRNYIDGMRRDGTEGRAIVIGSLEHTLLALRYQRIIDPSYPLTCEYLYRRLLELNCNPEYIEEGWRLYEAYDRFYAVDPLVPLAVEYHTVDPVTGESCRYDLIAKLEQPWGPVSAGTWIIEHKTTPRFDDISLTGWRGDGEILGQAMLYKRLKLSKKFGPLQGVLINLIGKQKEPEFTRVAVSVMPWQLKAHARDLRQSQALLNLFISLNAFPRYRANCINRYGKCSNWDHCADAERDI